MNINCIICSDLFSPSSEIYTTRCGHVFHYLCLITWFERSKTCPQCRQKTNEKSISRVYFNFATVEGVKEDAVSLQSKIDALSLNLRMKEKEFKEMHERFLNTVDDNKTLTNMISTNKEEIDKYKSGIAALKEQLLYAKVKARDIEKVENELKEAKQTVERLEYITKGINGSVEDAKDVARKCQDVKTLSQIVVSLRNGTDELGKKKDKYFLAMKRSERELHCCKKELEQYKKNNDILSLEVKAHENCEAERQALRKKIEEIGHITAVKKNPTIQRAMQESPMPQITRKRKSNLDDDSVEMSAQEKLQQKKKSDQDDSGIIIDTPDKEKSKKPVINNSFEIVDSPDVMTRVKAIKDSDSPYLQIKSNSMGMLLHSQGLSSRLRPSSSTSIFKSKRSETQVKPKIPEGVSYNGMGGTERNLFTKSDSTKGLKRQKSSASISSSKFRKLAKPTAQCKIDDLLNNISEID